MRSLSRISAIFLKELAQLRRDRMTFGMVIMIPLIQLVLFGYAINTNIRDIPVAVVDQSQTGLSRILIQMVEATRVVKVTERLTTPEEAEAAIKAARVRAAFILPDDLPQRIVRSPAFMKCFTSPRSRSRPMISSLAARTDWPSAWASASASAFW